MERQYVGDRSAPAPLGDCAGERSRRRARRGAYRQRLDRVGGCDRRAGESPEVAIEATYGWYWALDALEAQGAQMRLANPSGLEWNNRRVKNDYRDCKDLITRMRINKLPEEGSHRR